MKTLINFSRTFAFSLGRLHCELRVERERKLRHGGVLFSLGLNLVRSDIENASPEFILRLYSVNFRGFLSLSLTSSVRAKKERVPTSLSHHADL
jgi:hypothetical protein